jgi:hypothetical protein
MIRRLLGIALSGALVAGMLIAAPLTAEAVTEVPAKPNVVDEEGDANFLNDQDNITPAGHPLGDQNTGDDGGSVSDFLAIWFSHTADKISAHIQTEAPPPATTTIYYRLAANPSDDDARGCLRFQAIVGGVAQGQDVSTWRGENFARFENTCTDSGVKVGELTIETGPSESGITTLTFPRAVDPAFADNAKITGVYGISRVAVGQEGTELPTGGDFASAAQIDNTKRGTDYAIVPLIGDDPPAPPPGKGKKKGCPKGKGQKKGTCPNKKKKPKACAPYATTQEGAADAELTRITAAATEEKPIEVTLEAPDGTPAATQHVFQNAQVVSNPGTNGLYVRLEFPDHADLDLYLRDAAGEQVARAAGFNPAPEGELNDTAAGGHSETGAEQIDGFAVTKCAGYTVDVESFAFEGGEVLLKFWLGAPPQEEGVAAYEQVLALF